MSVEQEARDTASWMLIQYLWEGLLNMEDDPIAAVERVSAVTLRHANDAPHTPQSLALADGERLEMIRLHTIQELENFWDHIRMKLEMRHR
jgi:predicted RNA polymerase sigma factor